MFLRKSENIKLYNTFIMKFTMKVRKNDRVQNSSIKNRLNYRKKMQENGG